MKRFGSDFLMKNPSNGLSTGMSTRIGTMRYKPACDENLLVQLPIKSDLVNIVRDMSNMH